MIGLLNEGLWSAYCFPGHTLVSVITVSMLPRSSGLTLNVQFGTFFPFSPECFFSLNSLYVFIYFKSLSKHQLLPISLSTIIYVYHHKSALNLATPQDLILCFTVTLLVERRPFRWLYS